MTRPAVQKRSPSPDGRRASVRAIRAKAPGPLCPDGFDPVWAYLRANNAPVEVCAAWRRAQTGAAQLRGCMSEALRLAGRNDDGGER